MKNLYSILSKKGRGGDTELRYVNGELAHVNSIESDLIDNYGKAGEDYVSNQGSGTINPETGLKEYIDPITAITLGSAIFNAGSKIFEGVTQAGANKRITSAIDNQISNLQNQFSEIDLNTEDLLENLSQRTELKQRDQFTDFLSKSEDIQSSGDLAISRANLATSGGILENLNRRREDLLTDFGERTEALEFEEEDRTLAIASDAENAKQALQNQILSLQSTRAQYG